MATQTAQGNNYPNPLDNYRSYSYHFVMTAASTTEAFRTMISNNGSGLLSAIQSKQLGDSFTVNNQKGFLVLDTRRFSQYQIQSMDMDHVYGTGSKTNPSVPAGEMHVKLLDTTGLSFFDFMIDLMRNKLQTTRAAAFFLMSIIFTGHTDSGQTETVSTCHIPLMLLNMGFSANHTGSEFDITFIELDTAPQRGASLTQIDYLGQISSSRTKAGGENTIGEFIDDLEEELNLQSLQFYQKYKNTANVSSSSKPTGKLVQYMINIPDDDKNPWRKMKVTTARLSASPETRFKSTGTPSRSGPPKPAPLPEKLPPGVYSEVSFTPASGITNAIKMILESSLDFVKLSSEENVKKGTAKAYKMITSITCDESTYVIHFDVYPYSIPKTDDKKQLITGGEKRILGNSGKVVNLINYDYMFTGRNSHITDLKIHYDPIASVALDTDINIGLGRFRQQAEVGSNKAKQQDASKSDVQKSPEYTTMIRPGDPLFLPYLTKAQTTNNTAQHTEHLGSDENRKILQAKQEYTKTYASLHFLSSISMDMGIRGNPNIIRKFADRGERGFPIHTQVISNIALDNSKDTGNLKNTNLFKTVKQGLSSAKQQYINNFYQLRISAYDKPQAGKDDLLNGIDVSILPIFVKVNIQSPNVDWTGNYKSDSLFTNKFFFNGAYQLLLLHTSFSHGEFSHVMTLLPYDVDGSFSASGDNT